MNVHSPDFIIHNTSPIILLQPNYAQNDKWQSAIWEICNLYYRRNVYPGWCWIYLRVRMPFSHIYTGMSRLLILLLNKIIC